MLFGLAWAATALVGASATFSLSSTLGSHMVLNWNNPVVWGFDAPGSSVKITLASDTVTATTVRLVRGRVPHCPTLLQRARLPWLWFQWLRVK